MHDVDRRAIKVPELTVWFWIAKLVTTALGEAISDDLVKRFDPVPVVLAGLLAFVAAIAWQLRLPRYHAAVYWIAALMVSVFGTMAADVVHVGMGIPYLVSAVAYALALAAVFAVWHRSEGTLSIHSIDTARRETFYWLTALTTFALGTATGDLTAVTFHLGYLRSGLVFAVLFAVPLVAHRRFGLDGVLAFWCSYVATRPLGASFADWAAKPRDAQGLGRGDGPVSLVLGSALVAVVVYLVWSRIDDPGGRALAVEPRTT